MGHGIGPQSLGASGMNPKSTACGHPKITPLDFNDALEQAAIDGKLNKPFEKKVLANMEKKTEDDSSTSPVEFNVFENADPRAAANMMSDMASTGGGAPAAPTPAPAPAAPNTGGPFGGITGGVAGMLRERLGSTRGRSSFGSKYGDRKGRGAAAEAAIANIKQKTDSLPGFGSAGPTVNSPGGGSGGAIAAAEAAQASADAANSQMDALKEKLSGIRSQLDSLSGMI